MYSQYSLAAFDVAVGDWTAYKSILIQSSPPSLTAVKSTSCSNIKTPMSAIRHNYVEAFNSVFAGRGGNTTSVTTRATIIPSVTSRNLAIAAWAGPPSI